MKLSAIKQVKPSDLRKNLENEKYFDLLQGKEFQRLAEDIKKNGIKVPLVAKQDGTLLAGHNRLLIAKTLNLKTVPVQYVTEKLPKNGERDYMIADNLYRRQLTPSQRDALYAKMFPDFADRVLIKNDKSGVGIDCKEVAEKTGLPIDMVRGDVKRLRWSEKRRIAKSKEVKSFDVDVCTRAKKSVSAIVNAAMLADVTTIGELVKIFETAISRMKTARDNAEARK